MAPELPRAPSTAPRASTAQGDSAGAVVLRRPRARRTGGLGGEQQVDAGVTVGHREDVELVEPAPGRGEAVDDGALHRPTAASSSALSTPGRLPGRPDRTGPVHSRRPAAGVVRRGPDDRLQ